MQWETWVWDDAGKASAVTNGVTFMEVAVTMDSRHTHAIRVLGPELAVIATSVGLDRYIAVTVVKLDAYSPVLHVVRARPITRSMFRAIQEG